MDDNGKITKLCLMAGNDSNHDKENIKAEDESKNEGTDSVNTCMRTWGKKLRIHQKK